MNWEYMRLGRSDAMMGKPGWNPDNPAHLARIVHDGKRTVARIPDPWEGFPEKDADATGRLITAAPALLAACKAMLSSGGLIGDRADVLAAVQQMRAAVRAAQ